MKTLKTVGLVAFSGCKLGRPAPAREMCVSLLFKLSCQYAARRYDCWFVLSAQGGLLHPNEEVEPCEERPEHGWGKWSRQVAWQLARFARGHVRYVLAPEAYVTPLSQRIEVCLPFHGMLTDARLAFLRRELAAREGGVT
jgi:hypothetical protein